MFHSIYHYLGYVDTCEDISPDDKVIRQRHLVMKQIKDSKLKLKPIIKPVKPVKHERSETYNNKLCKKKK